MIAELDPNPIKKLPIPINGMFIETKRMPHPATVINQEMSSAVFRPLLSATKGMTMYPTSEPK